MPRLNDYERRCLDAIEEYANAHGVFLDMAERAAEHDADEERAFLEAEHRLEKAQMALWPFVKQGRRPPLYQGTVYLPGAREGQVRAVQVHDLVRGGPG